MFKIIYPENDATLYEAVPDTNTGLDEILEVGKRPSVNLDSSFGLSRSLIKFDMNEVSNTLSKYNVQIDDCKFVLQLYTTHAKNLPSNYTIDANAVAQNWINGTGTLNSSTTTDDGCTWNRPETGSTSFWTGIGDNVNQPFGSNLYIAGSGKGGSWLYDQNTPTGDSGGTHHHEEFNDRPSDINMDVTSTVKLWIDGSNGIQVPNYGFILKFSDLDETAAHGGFVRFFSRNTHTIYVPRLLMYFDKSSFSTGDLSPIDLDSYTIYTKLKKSYKDIEVSKIRIYGRDKYPQKSPTNLFPMQSIKHLPNNSLYTIIDAATDETIVPYDNNYTKISCDATSSFINLDVSGLMPERYYRLEFKIIDGFLEEYVSDKFYFKVTR